MTSDVGRALAAMRKTRICCCKECGSEFKAVDKRATYCSNKCRMKAKNRRNEAPYFDKPCEACGEVMFTNDRRLKYCSTSCRGAAAALRRS
jgi:hypothetical protein